MPACIKNAAFGGASAACESRANNAHAGRLRLRMAYFMVGMTNSDPPLMPLGQRAVTVLVLV